jgi:hypothetical protein
MNKKPLETAKSPTVNTRQMLAAEFAHVRGMAKPPNPDDVYEKAMGYNLSALCLSGGGIRSAAFCLGVIQALAGKEVLQKFHYLSTVSGGGFIGGWLQQLIRETEKTQRPDAIERQSPEDRVAQAEAILRGHEPPALDRLRDNTNYLTPKVGPASADTWTGVALYLRNLTLNWIAFAPVFLLAALAPILHRTFIWWAGAYTGLAIGILVAAMLMLGWDVYLACHWLPSHRPPEQRIGKDNRKKYKSETMIIIAFALAWAALLPVTLKYLLAGGWQQAPDTGLYWYAARFGIPFIYFLVLAAAYGLASLFVPTEDTGKDLFHANRIPWLFAAFGSAATFSLLLHLLLQAGPWLREHDGVADGLTLAAPIVLLCVLLAHTTFYLGLRREALRSDLDREWLARMNGIILGIGVGWTVFAASCIIPTRLTLPNAHPNAINIGIAAIGTLASGFASSWLGKQVIASVQSLVGKRDPVQLAVRFVQSVLPVIFVVALFAVLATALQFGLGAARDLPFLPPPPKHTAHAQPPAPLDLMWMPNTNQSGEPGTAASNETTADSVDGVPILVQIVAGVIFFGLILVIGSILNVNRFSMHAVYRNRLTRAFLGTPRGDRKPDPFIGFDDEDDARLKDFKVTCGAGGQHLFPVINMTLNVTTGERDAWAERKGASFIATPLYCGAAELRTSAPDGEQIRPGAFVPTEAYAGKETDQDSKDADQGPHFGSMLTISGAAASPNWGYHSSPQIAFLMTLFNVRLGAWYPNPIRSAAEQLKLAKPSNSLLALLSELVGRTTDNTQALYLSDGGHFENLGVYEMLRRRCTRILVIDAGQDGDCTFFDLGMMIRKAEIDLPVKIELATPFIASRKAIEAGKADTVRGFAYGTIKYVRRTGEVMGTGEIIYIKPTLLPDAPAAVRAFAAEDDAFPHDSTENQWFAESQFESYRALGQHQAEKLTALLPDQLPEDAHGDCLKALFDAVGRSAIHG